MALKPTMHSGLDITIHNVNEMNELQYKQFNHEAKATAERMLDSVSRKSPDFQDYVAKWFNDLSIQKKRGNTYQKQEFSHERPRDTETGRYVPTGNRLLDELESNPDPRSETDILAEVERHAAERRAANEAKQTHQAPVSNFDTNLMWAMRGGQMVQVPRRSAANPTDYPPGTGSGLPVSTNGQVGNLGFVHPSQWKNPNE